MEGIQTSNRFAFKKLSFEPAKAEEGAPMKATPGLASLANFRQAAAKTNFAEPAGLSDCARQYYSDNFRSVGANSMEAGRQPESAMNSKNQHLHSVHQRYKVPRNLQMAYVLV